MYFGPISRGSLMAIFVALLATPCLEVRARGFTSYMDVEDDGMAIISLIFGSGEVRQRLLALSQ